MIDLYVMSRRRAKRTQWQVPRNRSQYFQPLFPIDIATQCILDSDALEMVSRLYQRIKISLLAHGYCDGGGCREDERRDDICWDEAGYILVHFVTQRPFLRLDKEHLIWVPLWAVEVVGILLQSLGSDSGRPDVDPCDNAYPVRPRGLP